MKIIFHDKIPHKKKIFQILFKKELGINAYLIRGDFIPHRDSLIDYYPVSVLLVTHP